MGIEDRPRIVIVGGGTAGLCVASRLRRTLRRAEVVVIEPSEAHYYQPLWTLVGAGVLPREATARKQGSVIPSGVDWVRDAVTDYAPLDRAVVTRESGRIDYDCLVVAQGIQIDWNGIKGLQENIGRNGVCSNYAYETVGSTWECLRGFQGGNAIFTVPSTAIKCGGAPQKIMYLAEDHLRRRGLRETSRVIFASAGPRLFSVAKYREVLERIVEQRGIETRFRQELTEIRGEDREAVFEHLDTGETTTLGYDMLHVTPPMGAPDAVKRSALADEAGWVAVDKHSLQHVRFPNVFALGDASSLPTAKTGAAIRKQAPVLVENLAAYVEGRPLTASYDGYTSCPILTRYGRVILAEFDYEQNPKESFPFDQSKERFSMWLLKRYGLPLIYWHGMLKGRL